MLKVISDRKRKVIEFAKIFQVDDWETIYKWISFGIYWAAMFVFILWHVIGSFVEPSYFPDQKS